MDWHWQNLNERPGGRHGSGWRAGRAWLHLGREYGSPVLRAEWHFGRLRCGLRLTVDGQEDDFVLGVDLPGVTLYLAAEQLVPAAWRRRLPSDPHSIGWSLHDGGLWWDCWQNDVEWRSGTPRWRHGHVDPGDALLGRQDHRREVLRTEAVEIPMPERTYAGTVTLFESVWTRRRWPRWPFTRRLVRAEIDVPGGIPHPGKGENAWDCGEDATFGLTCVAQTAEAAVARLIESVLRDRRRDGGPPA